MNAELEAYVRACTSPEDDYLYRLYRATHLHLLRPRMASGHLQGRLLRLLAQLLKPRTVVEIGTYSGYSALSIASGMSAGGRLLTFEINDEQEDFTRPWLEGAPYEVRPEMVVGDVFELLPSMRLSIDLAFVDANKRDYISYYELLLPYMRDGGLIVADNTLWDGHVVEEEYRRDPQTLGIIDFNRHVADDPRVEQILLPLRDGISLIRVRDRTEKAADAEPEQG